MCWISQKVSSKIVVKYFANKIFNCVTTTVSCVQRLMPLRLAFRFWSGIDGCALFRNPSILKLIIHWAGPRSEQLAAKEREQKDKLLQILKDENATYPKKINDLEEEVRRLERYTTDNTHGNWSA